jgi:hypothetical protein
MSRSKHIIEEVAQKHHLSVDDILSRDKSAFVVAARREAIRRMRVAKMTTAVISAALGLDRSTILYHSTPGKAQRQSTKLARRYQEQMIAKRPESFRVKIRPEYLSKLSQLASLTDASIEAFVNQTISDALEAA